MKTRRIAKSSEAGTGVKGLETASFWNWEVSSAPYRRVLSFLLENLNVRGFTRPFFLVTAYSENWLEARSNPGVERALKKADMIVPDGVVLLAGIDFLKEKTGKFVPDFIRGMEVGRRVISGVYANRTVQGVRLMEDLVRLMGENGGQVFLLGGWNGVARRLAEKLKVENEKLKVEWDQGFVDINNQLPISTDQIITKINEFKPDILFVAFGRIKQEIWIAQNLEKLKAKLVIGVGSAFDELAGEGPWAQPTPEWVSSHGLKWLWRVTKDPKHLKRAWKAFPVTAWKIFRS